MERESIPVKPGWEYDHYFPRAQVGTVHVKSGATVQDTLRLIPEIVRISMPQCERFAREVIKGKTIEETCRNLWNFTYTHIAYRKDAAFKEQVRDVARIWHDRFNVDPKNPSQKMGVDCDCMSVWCAAILCTIGLGKYLYFRITKYPDPKDPSKTADQIGFSHIYPILKLPNGKQITIDCVVHQFNYEEPYLQKQDTAMDLEYLNGVPDRMANADTQDLMGMMDEQQALSELGKIFKKKAAAKNNAGGNAAHQKKKGGLIKKIGKGIGKGFHVINRINPATALLRGGVLAAMKLNFLKIAGSLRWSYLSEEAAKAKGIIMDKYHKLIKIREKLEKIFFGAGGKPENLKKAMLKGHGNKDKSVPLAGFGATYENAAGLHEDMSLRQLLGPELYHSEYVDGMDGFEGFAGLGELGEPATAASIAAATTVLSAIAALIKGVGNIFPNKGAKGKSGDGGSAGDNGATDSGSTDSGSGGDTGSSSTDSSSSTPSETNSEDNSSASDPAPPAGDNSSGSEDNSSPGEESVGADEDGATNGSAAKSKAPAKPARDADDDDDPAPSSTPASRTANKTATPDPTKKVSFWQKKWVKPAAISVGSLALIALVYKLLKPKPKLQQAVNGLTRKRKRKPKGDFLNGIKPKPKKGGTPTAKRKTKKKKKVITLL